MKKHILLLCLALTTSTLWSQKNETNNTKALFKIAPNVESSSNDKPIFSTEKSTPIWSDDFSDPSTWEIVTTGQGSFIIGNNSDPGITSATDYMGAMETAGTSAANGFAFFNGVQYLLNADVDPQDTWVASDTIDLSGTSSAFLSLKFNQRYRAFNYDQTFVEFSEDGGATWTAFSADVNIDVATNADAVQNNVSVLIPTTNSALSMIRFRWISDSDNDQYASGYGWMIDDVELYEPYDNELSLEKLYTHDIYNDWDYYETPLSQAQSTTIFAIIKNNGAASQTQDLTVEISGSGGQAPSSSNVSFTVEPGATDTVIYDTGFTPSLIGGYTVTATLPEDSLATNNSLSEDFEMTQHLYGHNHPLGSSIIDFTQEGLVGVGNQFGVVVNEVVKGLDVSFASGTTSGLEVEVLVYEVVSNIQDAANVFVGGAIGGLYVLPSPVPTNTSLTIPLENLNGDIGISLEAGKVYMALVSAYQDSEINMAIKRSTKGDDDFSTVCFGPFGEGDAENYYNGWGWSPAVKLNFEPTIGISENNSNVHVGDIFPNPVSSESVINILVDNAQQVEFTIVNLSGKTVKTNSMNLEEGENQVSIDSSDLPSGAYRIVISTEDTLMTRMFVKK
jgi:hypothetical protein